MELRRQAEDGQEFKPLVRGWCLGSEAFRQELLDQMRESRGDHYGTEWREADETHAEKVVARELRQRGWQKAQLTVRRKGDKEKVLIARRLRQETTMTLKWIAQRLQMGTWTYVSNLLAQKRKK